MELGMAFMNPLLADQRMKESSQLMEKRAYDMQQDKVNEPLRRRALEATVGTAELGLSEKTRAVAADKNLSSLSMEGLEGKPESVVLRAAAGHQMRSGYGADATELLKLAAQAGQREAAQSRAQAYEENLLFGQAQKRADFLARGATLAGTPEGYAQWNMLYEKNFGQPSPYATVPWSPQVAAALGVQGITATDQVKLAQAARKEQRMAADAQERIGIAQQQLGLSRLRAGLLSDREARLAKNSGLEKPLTNAEVTRTARWLAGNPELADFPVRDLMNAGAEVAEIARDIRRGNPAVPPEIARFQALSRVKDKFVTEGPGGWLGALGLGADVKRFDTSKPSTVAGPKPGTVMQGYRFKGGDPGNKANWERTQ